MNDIVIKIENLSKQYRYGVVNHGMLYRDIEGWWARLRGKEDPNSIIGACSDNLKRNDKFWALKDINLDIKKGETLGIIGRNGAGKSTLLKILSRITAPTFGTIKVKGRIASLLEVGTGFHSELTGRENIYLNGAILGMNKKEINRKFNDIVAFSEVEDFIDTPVKRYSSGMYVRLAFAVAAYLDPEILLVDEVLAVGDTKFQKKCLGKMDDAAKEGKTILYVSHSMPTVTSLCSKTILLDGGKMVQYGKTSDVVLAYYSGDSDSSATLDYSTEKIIGDDHARLIYGAVIDSNNDPVNEIDIRQQVKIIMKYEITNHNNLHFVPNIHFYTANGSCAFVSSTKNKENGIGIYEAECTIPGNFLNEGAYFVGFALSSFDNGVLIHFYEQNALSFNVKDPIFGMDSRGQYVGAIPGAVRPLLDWKVRKII